MLLGTDAGMWSTDDITAANPGWSYTGTGMGALRVNQLRYRASDGRVTAATNGRGVWQSDALAVSYSTSTIAVTGISNTTLCAGSTVSVSYSTSGPAFAGTTPTVEVWLSDASGSFSNQRRVATGTSSPLSFTLPGTNNNALAYGISYQLRLVAPVQGIESEQIGPVAIGNTQNAIATDRRAGDGSGGYFTSGEICPGSRATLTAYARSSSNTPVPADSYQWTLNGGSISGATSKTLSVQQGGTYQCTVKQAGCTVQSNTYVLYTTSSLNPSVQPVLGELPQCTGTSQTLRSTYIAEGAMYQWKRDGSDIAGATTDTLLARQSGLYSFRLTDGNCTATAQGPTLTFGSSLYARAVRSVSTDSVLCVGSNNSIYMTADGIYPAAVAAGQYAIQWYRNNIPIAGASQTGYSANQAGTYTFLLQQGTCSTRSNALVVTQGTAIAPPTISEASGNNQAQTACPGEIRYLNASGGNGSYQWQRDGVDISGATNSQYQAQVSGNYTCRVSSNTCQATSAPLSLTFTNAIVPVVLPLNNTDGIGCTSNFLQYSSSGPLSGGQYQWFRNGDAVSGGTNSYLAVNQSGLYSIRVISGACTGLSKAVSIQLGQAAKPVIKTSPPQGCPGNSVQLSASNYQGSLRWMRNGVAIAGSTGSRFYAVQSGLYTVLHQDGSCAAESVPVRYLLANQQVRP